MKYQNIIQNTIAYLDQQKLYGNELFFNTSFKKNEPVLFKEWKNLNEIKNAIQSCRRCRLADNSSGKIMGKGNQESNIMIISDTPAILKNSNKELELLTKILAAIEFTPEEVYISSIIKCNLSLNRGPLNDEISYCIPYLLGQIKFIKPKIILVLGETAGNALLGREKDIRELRENNYYKFKGAYIYVTYHPAALVKNNDPDQKKKKRLVWEDVKRVRSQYDKIVGDKLQWL
ncbi:MAG: uracil-DNA glycosylase [bacterium]